MKLFYKFFLKIILPIVIIIAACVTFYAIATKPNTDAFKAITSLSEQHVKDMKQFANERIDDVKKYEERIYYHELESLRSEKTKFFIVVVGTSLILFVFFINIVGIILKLPKKYLLHPDEFSVVSKLEADALNYVKDKLIESNIINDESQLLKKDIMKLLAYHPNKK